MADIHIRRTHTLGLAKARKIAWKWAESVEEKFAMECTVIERHDGDVVEFRRAGVDGRLVVDAHAFDLTAKLGLLLGAFSGRIESEIRAQLDKLVPPAAARGAAAKEANAGTAKAANPGKAGKAGPRAAGPAGTAPDRAAAKKER